MCRTERAEDATGCPRPSGNHTQRPPKLKKPGLVPFTGEGTHRASPASYERSQWRSFSSTAISIVSLSLFAASGQAEACTWLAETSAD